MDFALKLMALIALSVFLIICIWGFVLYNRYIEDVRKQNIMLFSILEKLGFDKKKDSI